MTRFARLLQVSLAALALAGCARVHDPLPSWNDTPTRRAILAFVEDATTPGGERFVPEHERVAVFDNDGTLWAEQPAYFQLLFAVDRVRVMAHERPEWRTTQPFQGAIEGDLRAVAQSGHEGVAHLVAATHAGMTTDEFAQHVREWLRTARHPRTGRPFTEMVYQPMLELLEHLRERGFATYIVSGGGVEFMRVFSEEVYGVSPERVIGSTIKTEFAMAPGGPVIRRLAEIDFFDDGPGKPVAINRVIGRRPTIAFGNSDGDLQMLQWTDAGDGPRLSAIVHHTDARREYQYDRESPVGRLDKALDEARERGWLVIDMRADWSRIFPDSPAGAAGAPGESVASP